MNCNTTHYRANSSSVPGDPTVNLEGDDQFLTKYQAEQEARTALGTERELLKKQAKALPPASATVDELDVNDPDLEQFQAWQKEREALQVEITMLGTQARTLPRSEYGSFMLDLMEQNAAAWAQYRIKKQLMEQRVAHDCPACAHHWDDEDPRLKTEFADVPDEAPEAADTDATTLAQLRRVLEASLQREALENTVRQKQEELSSRVDYTEEIKSILMTRVAFAASQQERGYAAQRIEITDRLAAIKEALSTMEDRQGRITMIMDARSRRSQYEAQLPAYQKDLAEIHEAKEKLAQFSPQLDLELATNLLHQQKASAFESDLKRFTEDYTKYLVLKGEVDLKQAELVDWENGKKAVLDLRAKVKGFLLPSLNKVASHLLNEMTGGELSWLIVNDQFEITVEGQRLETLSGSGKAVANLALRLALGQVLTARVFNSVMLDEIDASMDDERATYVATCLRRLTSTIAQVILVSHKQGLEADHHVRL